jgi:RNA polymerase subunit RPABC4/transcription elongation factor Spt4
MCEEICVCLKDLLRVHGHLVINTPERFKGVFLDYLPGYLPSQADGQPFILPSCYRAMCNSFKTGLPQQVFRASQAGNSAVQSVEDGWVTLLTREIHVDEDTARHTVQNWESVFNLVIVPDQRLCPVCKYPYDKDEVICQNCGRQLTANKSCPNCHDMVPANAKFCPNCGLALTKPAR